MAGYRLPLLLILFTLTSAISLYAQDSEIIFNEGVEAYASEDYKLAIDKWERLISSGYYSPELYYNLGNAWFKEGSIPGAILYYEKALLLKPFNEDYRYNLEIALAYTTDRFETVPEVFFVRWYKMLSLLRGSNSWAMISLVLFILSLLLILVYLFSSGLVLKKVSFYAGLLLIFFSLVSLSLSYMNKQITVKRQSAIIFTPVVTGKSSPGNDGKDLFVIHEGTKVRIEDQIGEWAEVRLSDGNVGWILLSDIRKV
ncbi:MAG: tetratricopeptide repeat protein [Marinilabiliaceae bacterium]|jgi:tetratricopeptide (TPR) repeat protein|nr:tetratricopeptide repeat protein [Marinilabiliaceae bacterium]